MRLLWVENNARFVAAALPTFLSAHSVCVVPSLAEARKRFSTETYDAILLDYDLDDGKGTDLIPLALILSPRPLLIAASSHTEGNTQLLKAGADAICSKMEFMQIETVLEAGLRFKAENSSR